MLYISTHRVVISCMYVSTFHSLLDVDQLAALTWDAQQLVSLVRCSLLACKLEWPLLVLLVPCLLCATTERRSKQRLGESRLPWIHIIN